MNNEFNIELGVQVKTDIEKLNKQIAAIEKKLNKLNLDVKIDTKSLTQLTTQIEKLANMPKIDLVSGVDSTLLNTTKELDLKLKDINQQLKFVGKNTQENTVHQEGFNHSVADLGMKIMVFNSLTQIFYRTISATKEAISYIVELDSKLVSFKKVLSDDVDSIAFKNLTDELSRSAIAVGHSSLAAIEAATSWKQLGYNIEEASEQAENSLIFSNISDQNIEKASKQLISILKGFNLDLSETTKIMDILNEVGNNTSSTTEDLGKALLNSASSLSAANNSLEESVALIVSANSSVRDANKVGTALKTVSARVRGIADEEGEIVSGLREKVKELADVDIMLDATTFKSTFQIIKELSENLKNLSDIERADLYETLFGKQNINVGASLLSNFNEGLSSMEYSINSTGSAARENEAIMKGLDKQINELHETIKFAFSDNISKEFLGDVISEMTELVKTFGDAKTVVALFATSFAVLKGASVMKSLTKIKDSFNGFMGTINANITAIKQYQVTLGTASVAEKALATSTLTLKVAFDSLKTAFLSNPFGMVALAVTSVITVMDVLKRKEEQATEAAKERNKTLLDEKDKLEDLVKKYQDLSAAEQTVDIRNQLSSVQQTLIDQYGLEANAIDLLNGKYEENIVAINEARKAKLQAIIDENKITAEQYQKDVSGKNYGKITLGYSNGGRIGYTQELFGTEKLNIEEYINELEKLRDKLNNKADEFANISNANRKKLGSQINNELNELKTELQDKQSIINSVYDSIAEQVKIDTAEANNLNIAQQALFDTLSKDIKYNPENEDHYKNSLQDIAKTLQSIPIEKFNDLKNAYAEYQKALNGTDNNKIVETANAVQVVKDEIIKTTGESENLNKVLGTFDTSVIESVGQKASNSNISTLYDSFVKVRKEFESGAIKSDEYTDSLKKQFEEIENLIKANPEMTKGYKYIAEIIKNSIATAPSTLKDLRDATLETVDSAYTLSAAFKEQKETGNLSLTTTLKLIDLGYAAALSIDSETGAVTINTQAYLQLAQAKINEQVVSLKINRDALKTKLESEQTAVSDLADEYYRLGEEAIKSAVKEASARATTTEAELAAKNAEIAALELLKGDLSKVPTGNYKPYSSSSSSKKDFEKQFDFAEKAIDRIDQQIKSLENTIDDTLSFEDKNSVIDEIIKLQKSKVDSLQSAIDLYNAEAKKSFDKIPKSLQDSVANGSINLATIKDEKVSKAIDEFNKWNDSAVKLKNEINNVNKSVNDLRTDKFNNSMESFEKSLKPLTDKIEDLDFELKMLGENDFDKKMELINEKAKKQSIIIEETNHKLADLKKQYQNGEISQQDFEQGFDSLNKSMKDGIITGYEYTHMIHDLVQAQKQFELDKIEDSKSAMNDLISLTEDYIRQKAQDEIKAIESTIDGYENEIKALQDKSKELDKQADLQKKMVDAQKKALDEETKRTKELADLQKKALQDKLDAHKKIIDEQKKSLDIEKEQYDYNKSLSEKQKNISKLEQEIADLSTDTSRAGIAERKKKEEELSKLKADLDDFNFKHSVDKQKDALDSELKNYEDTINNEIKLHDEKYDAILKNYENEKQLLDDLHNSFIENKNREKEILQQQQEQIQSNIDNEKKGIKEIQDSISNNTQLRKDAMALIDSEGENLKDKLIAYNNEYGTGIERDVVEKWKLANETMADGIPLAQQYVDLVNKAYDLQNSLSSMSNGTYGFSATDSNVGVRQYLTDKGYNVGWNENTKNVSVNGNEYSGTSNFDNIGDRLYGTEKEIEEMLKSMGLWVGSYATGGKVPEDGFARVHKDEIILPVGDSGKNRVLRKYNPETDFNVLGNIINANPALYANEAQNRMMESLTSGNISNMQNINNNTPISIEQHNTLKVDGVATDKIVNQLDSKFNQHTKQIIDKLAQTKLHSGARVPVGMYSM